MRLRKKVLSFLLSGAMTATAFSAMPASAATTPDPNGDGVIDISDAVYIMQYLVGLFEPTDLSKLDVDGNGLISQMDATYAGLYEIGTLPEKG